MSRIIRKPALSCLYPYFVPVDTETDTKTGFFTVQLISVSIF